MPSPALRVSQTPPDASRRYARADVVPQSIAIKAVLRDSATARDGSRRSGPGQEKPRARVDNASATRTGAGAIARPAVRGTKALQAAGSAGFCHRAAASSSLVRASTQRAPAAVSSFFQNGARVLR